MKQLVTVAAVTWWDPLLKQNPAPGWANLNMLWLRANPESLSRLSELRTKFSKRDPGAQFSLRVEEKWTERP